MRKNLRTITACLVFLFLLTWVIAKIAEVVERKDSYAKYMDFYGEEEAFDVLFFGTSHLISGVFPMELWNDYGIVSYNMANHAETLAETYWVLKNTLDYKTPRLVVIDLYKIPLNEKISRNEESGELLKEYLHDYMDSVPLSWTKLQAIRDLLPADEWMEFLFDFSMYHGRWSSLGQGDFEQLRTLEKGAEARTEIVSAEAPERVDREQRTEEDTVGKQYLRRMIELCQEKNIEVLLTYIPYGGITEEQCMWANSGYTIAEDYGIPYENLLEVEGLINYTVDCSDSDSHLNVSGGRKVTEYLGRYIREHYQLADHRDEEAYKRWFEDYQAYMEQKIDSLTVEADLYTYLLLLNDKSMSSCYYIRPDSAVYEDEMAMELLNNIGNIQRLEEARVKNESYFVLVDNYAGHVYEMVGEEELHSSVCFGLFEYDTDENGEKQLHIEYSQDNYLTDSKERPSDMHILVFDNASGEMVDKARFIIKDEMTRKEIKR